MVWDQHPHVELLASSINFIVHERGTIESAEDSTVADLVKSINALEFPGISIDVMDTDIMQTKQQTIANEILTGMHSEMSQLTQDMHRMMTCMQTLQTKLSTLESEMPHNMPTPSTISRQDSRFSVQDTNTGVPESPVVANTTVTYMGPSSGWKLRHLRNRYLCTTRITLFGAKCVWTGEIVIDSDDQGHVKENTLEALDSSNNDNKREELRAETHSDLHTGGEGSVEEAGSGDVKKSVEKEVLYKRSSTCIPVTGYMRWRLINAIPEDKDYDISAMANLQTMITDNHEADEVFQGYFDTEFGSLETRTEYTRAVPGNPADLDKQVAKCVYSFVLIKDGSEMNGRSILDCQREIPNSDFPNLPVHRCIAY